VTLDAAHLELSPPVPAETPAPVSDPAGPVGDLRSAVDRLQREAIAAALERTGHNWAAAARELGLDRANLQRLAKRLGLR
jgi:anaerobic nitric oxide reductase transcription regulator